MWAGKGSFLLSRHRWIEVLRTLVPKNGHRQPLPGSGQKKWAIPQIAWLAITRRTGTSRTRSSCYNGRNSVNTGNEYVTYPFAVLLLVIAHTTDHVPHQACHTPPQMNEVFPNVSYAGCTPYFRGTVIWGREPRNFGANVCHNTDLIKSRIQ